MVIPFTVATFYVFGFYMKLILWHFGRSHF